MDQHCLRLSESSTSKTLTLVSLVCLFRMRLQSLKLNWLVRQACETEKNIESVGRVLISLTKLLSIAAKTVKSAWPERGTVEFRNNLLGIERDLILYSREFLRSVLEKKLVSLADQEQDPVLVSTTIRQNLDPFESHTDNEIWYALESAHIGDKIRELPDKIYTKVLQNGENFTVGQRQLMCLAVYFPHTTN